MSEDLVGGVETVGQEPLDLAPEGRDRLFFVQLLLHRLLRRPESQLPHKIVNLLLTITN